MSDDPIERYLDGFFIALRSHVPREARSLLAETEAHLRDAADAGEREGLDALTAAARAVDRFGHPDVVAGTDRDRVRTPFLVRLALTGWQLGAVGAMAVGVSGLFGAILRILGASDAYMAASSSTGNLPAADCARWQSLHPTASNCASAALADWAAETIGYRFAIGVLGAIALAALALVRRRVRRARSARALPTVVSDSVATVAFGTAGVWLVGLAIDAYVSRTGHTAGAWLTAAPVALTAACFYGRRLARELATPSTLV